MPRMGKASPIRLSLCRLDAQAVSTDRIPRSTKQYSTARYSTVRRTSDSLISQRPCRILGSRRRIAGEEEEGLGEEGRCAAAVLPCPVLVLDTLLHFSVHQPIGQFVYVCANKTKKGCLSQASVHAVATTGTLSVFPDSVTAQLALEMQCM
jgi:hypothetical protein